MGLAAWGGEGTSGNVTRPSSSRGLHYHHTVRHRSDVRGLIPIHISQCASDSLSTCVYVHGGRTSALDVNSPVWFITGFIWGTNGGNKSACFPRLLAIGSLYTAWRLQLDLTRRHRLCRSSTQKAIVLISSSLNEPHHRHFNNHPIRESLKMLLKCDGIGGIVKRLTKTLSKCFNETYF